MDLPAFEMPEWLCIMGEPTNTLVFERDIVTEPYTFWLAEEAEAAEKATGEVSHEYAFDDIDPHVGELLEVLLDEEEGVGIRLVHMEGREMRLNSRIVTDMTDELRARVTAVCSNLWNVVELDLSQILELEVVASRALQEAEQLADTTEEEEWPDRIG